MDSPTSLEISHPKKRAMLAALAKTGNVSASARAAGISRRTHYDWLATDPEYVRCTAEAREESIEVLEAIARKRAAVGSDVLLIFLLKSLRPEVYRDRYHIEHAGQIEHRRAVDEVRRSLNHLLTKHPELVKTLEDEALGMSLDAPKEAQTW